MSKSTLEACARQVIAWFQDNKIPYALVGGIAVSFRTIERTTLDLDFTLTVNSDAEAEAILLALNNFGFSVVTAVEQKALSRLATARLIKSDNPGLFVDLLFASSGIEHEIVQDAEEIELFPGLQTMVASIPSLIAMKVLSADNALRIRDISDLMNLFSEASKADLETAQNLLRLIQDRGYHRGKDLLIELDLYFQRYKASKATA